jgi:hypothetical protein
VKSFHYDEEERHQLQIQRANKKGRRLSGAEPQVCVDFPKEDSVRMPGLGTEVEDAAEVAALVLFDDCPCL